jgi:hypothetical protein
MHSTHNPEVAFSFGSSSVVQWFDCNFKVDFHINMCTLKLWGQQSKRLVPRSHKFQTSFSLSYTKYNKDQSLLRELPYHRPSTEDSAQRRRILKWLVATGLAISK